MPPKWLAFEDPPSIIIEEEDGTSPEILSPSHAAAGSLLGLIPMLSFEDSVSLGEDENVEPLDPSSASFYIKRFQNQFVSLKDMWERAFAEVETGYGLVVKDLQKLHCFAVGQAGHLGTPVALGEQTPDTVWMGLLQVHQTVNTQAETLATLSTDQAHLTHSVLALETTTDDINTSISDKVTTLTTDLCALESRVLRLVPMLAQLKCHSFTPIAPLSQATPQLEQFGTRLGACEQSVSFLKDMVATFEEERSSPTPSLVSPAIESRLKEIQVQMKQLQLKVVGKGVQIANRTFQTFEDVKVWVDTHPPTH
jgi:hypothetical protein